MRQKRKQIERQLRQNVYILLSNQLYSYIPLSHQIRHRLYIEIWDAVWIYLRDKVRNKIADSLLKCRFIK